MIWTDVFQMVIMLAGFVAVIARGATLQGGLGRVWNDSYHGGRLETFRYNKRDHILYVQYTVAAF